MTIMKDDHQDIKYGLMTSIAMMFERAVEQKDLVDFASMFFKSKVYKRFFDDWTIFSQSPLYTLELFQEELTAQGINYDTDIKDSDKLETDIAYWMGYLVSNWYIEYEQDPAEITKDNLLWLWFNYDTLHTQSCKYVYEVFQEEKGQTFPDYA